MGWVKPFVNGGGSKLNRKGRGCCGYNNCGKNRRSWSGKGDMTGGGIWETRVVGGGGGGTTSFGMLASTLAALGRIPNSLYFLGMNSGARGLRVYIFFSSIPSSCSCRKIFRVMIKLYFFFIITLSCVQVMPNKLSLSLQICMNLSHTLLHLPSEHKAIGSPTTATKL